MWECEQAFTVNQRGLLQDLFNESDDNQRILYQDEHAIAFRTDMRALPHEVWIAPSRLPHL